MVITIFVKYVPRDHPALVGGSQDHVRLDGAGRVDDQARTDAAVMAHRAAQYGEGRFFQLAVGSPCFDGPGEQVEVGERGPRADEGVAADDTHLQTGVLGYHAVVHQGSHEQGRAEGQKRAIPDY